MKRMLINLAPPGAMFFVYRTSWMIWLALLLGLSCLVTGLTQAWQERKKIVLQSERVRDLNKKISHKADSKPAHPPSLIDDTKAKIVNEALAELNLPWNPVFDALEAATPATIGLLSLAPDARRNVLHVVAEARDSESMVSYIAQLKKQPFFNNVFITMHDSVEADPAKPMRFQFDAHWQVISP